MITNTIYKVKGENVAYVKSFVSEVKRLNPNVDIRAKWIVRQEKLEHLTIISSIPLEQLILPENYHENEIGNIINLESEIELKENVYGDTLDFNIQYKKFCGFIKKLEELNPNAKIGYEFNYENGFAKIWCSNIPLEQLKFPNEEYSNIGIDKDGYVGFIKDKVIDYKISYEFDGMDSSKQFIEVTQRYFGNVSYEEQKKNGKIVAVNPQPTKMTPVEEIDKKSPEEELAKMARETRKFQIFRIERAMSDAQKEKNKAAIIAGICILGAVAGVCLNGQDINTVLQHELDAIYSWQALGQYLQDLGPLTTLLSAGAGAFIAKYFKNHRKFKQAQNELIDFNASIENTQNLGGNENAKAR